MSQLPNEAPIRINLAYALLHSGSAPEAMAELDALAGQGLHDMLRGFYALARADIAFTLQRYADCEIFAREAIAGSGSNAWAWITLALSLAAQKRIGEGQEALRQARQVMPRFTPEFYERAVRILYAGDESLFADRLKTMDLLWPAPALTNADASPESR
jgi:tetratricopeptide (TPR) repeat protein